MSLFSIETFYFLSMGIIGILIVMLIFHFRNKILLLEKQVQGLHGIATELVNSAKQQHLSNPYGFGNGLENVVVRKCEDDEEGEGEDSDEYVPPIILGSPTDLGDILDSNEINDSDEIFDSNDSNEFVDDSIQEPTKTVTFDVTPITTSRVVAGAARVSQAYLDQLRSKPIKEVVHDLVESVEHVVEQVEEQVKESLQEVVHKVGEGVKDMIHHVVHHLDNEVKEVIQEVGEQVHTEVKEFADEHLGPGVLDEVIDSAIDKVEEFVVDNVEEVVDKVDSKVDAKVDELVQHVDQQVDSQVQETLQEVVDVVNESVQEKPLQEVVDAGDDETVATVDGPLAFKKMHVGQLRQLAEHTYGILGAHKMKKSELVSALVAKTGSEYA